MLGERIPAEQALDWGMIARVVEDEELAAEAVALATRLAQGPTDRLRPASAASPATPSSCRSATRSPPNASPSATPAAPRISKRGGLPAEAPVLRRSEPCAERFDGR